ncbi:nucleotidyltransferase domain-containing protein [Microbacterium hominis]|uniref:Polymerase nucleotidyl transferase domain-containing protein n=1 Tax=Microbacterium hominis TaxID=162426 RepID=A0A0B4CU83_9MICO|nr:nucleotidyltransferase domain-containing protein [Microbacterium hominis]KIC57931.1 hypothetical protein RM52_07565 [Microbacterium hominis]
MQMKAVTVARPEIDRRRLYTQQRWEALDYLARTHFESSAVQGRAMIYVTGSLARGEATEGSDMDLFVADCLNIVKDCASSNPNCDHLNYVDTAGLVHRLDQVRHDAGFRAFSRGGEFIRTHHLSRLVELMGDPLDDAENAFTARILLLINSRSLWNQEAYVEARQRILDAYWKLQESKADFHPILLMNDLRRWWSVLCLNFERYNKRQVVDDYSAKSPASRRIANLKLRYARMIAAFTPILLLIDGSDELGRVSRESVESILSASPVERLEALERDGRDARTRELAGTVLDRYDSYLILMRDPESAVSRLVVDESKWREIKTEAYDFHADFSSLYRSVGSDRLLYEYAQI